MTFSKSPYSMEDVRDAMNAALSADNGVKLTFPKKGMAVNFVQRANYYRRIDAKTNREVYPEGHELRNQSIWDKLAISADETPLGEGLVIIRKRTATISNMEVF